jgi:hypothetical protein
MNSSLAKKIRKEMKKTQKSLAQDLKSWFNDQPWPKRVKIAFCIIFKRKW